MNEAKLREANLTGVHVGASLVGADVSGATLAGATLVSASLTGAELLKADLSGAHLQEVRLTDEQQRNVRALSGKEGQRPVVGPFRTYCLRCATGTRCRSCYLWRECHQARMPLTARRRR